MSRSINVCRVHPWTSSHTRHVIACQHRWIRPSPCIIINMAFLLIYFTDWEKWFASSTGLACQGHMLNSAWEALCSRRMRHLQCFYMKKQLQHDMVSPGFSKLNANLSLYLFVTFILKGTGHPCWLSKTSIVTWCIPSQHMHMWTFGLKWSLKLQDNNERKKHPCWKKCVVSDA